MIRTITKFWLDPQLVLSGAEGEQESETDSAQLEEPDKKEGEAQEGADDGSADEDKETYSKEEVENLRKTMREERSERKRLQKELKEAQRGKQTEEKREEADQLKEQQRASDERLAKLAAGYRESRVEQAVMRAARDARAINPEDVYDLLKSKGFPEIDVDQDDDDPSKVKVDENDVKTAVKNVLKNRQHWIQTAGDGNPSGSKFNPSGGRKTELDNEALKSKYPALRGRS